MRWIKCLGVVGLGCLVVVLLPDLRARPSKAQKARTPARIVRTATHRTHRPRPRTRPNRKLTIPGHRSHAMAKAARPRVGVRPNVVAHAHAGHPRVVARAHGKAVVRVQVQPRRKSGQPAKQARTVQVACRMILLISGMT